MDKKTSTGLAILNGAFYVTISFRGKELLIHMLGEGLMVESFATASLILGVSTFTIYMQHVFEHLTLDYHSIITKLFAIFAPLSALQYFSSGKEGAEYMGFNAEIALFIAFVLFGFRTVTCADAATKLPKIINDLKQAIRSVISDRALKQILRLGTGLTISISFSLCSIVQTAVAARNILSLLQIPSSYQHPADNIIGTLGVFGGFPLSIYWVLQGIDELISPNRYTIAGALMTLILSMQILGRVSKVDESTYGDYTPYLEVGVLISTLAFAITATLPNTVQLLKAFVPWIMMFFISTKEVADAYDIEKGLGNQVGIEDEVDSGDEADTDEPKSYYTTGLTMFAPMDPVDEPRDDELTNRLELTFS